jgi:hypothetical protein
MIVKTLGISLFIAIALTTSGCFGVRKLDVKDGYEGFKNLHPDQTAGPAKSGGGSIVVEVSAPQAAGCVIAKTADPKGEEKKGLFTCALFPVNEETAKKEIKAKKDSVEGAQNAGLLLLGYGDTLKTALEDHLKANVGNAKVKVTEKATGANPFIETEGVLYQKFWRTDDKRMTVKLTATPSGGGEAITVEKEAMSRMGNKHLGWMIPIGIATFPVGWAVGMAVFNNLEGDFIARVIAQTLHEAAGELAEKLAGQAAATGRADTHWQVTLSFI